MQTNLAQLRDEIRNRRLGDPATLLPELEKAASLSPEGRYRISQSAADMVRAIRAEASPNLMERFLGEYGLSSEEGVALMCLAEALLRVPDVRSIDALIRDKIAPGNWKEHIGSGGLTISASSWALMLTGQVLSKRQELGIGGVTHRLLQRLGEPVIRLAVRRVMEMLGHQFVFAETIEKAISEARKATTLYSFDMLGEAARTAEDAARYFDAYAHSISRLSSMVAASERGRMIQENPGISVKLSALHPRYEHSQSAAMLPEICDRLLRLARMAANAGIGLNIDAEEADRLDLSLDVIQPVLEDPSLKEWRGFGVVVQAYSPRALPLIEWLNALAEKLDRKIMVRLVKGAYWDSEIKHAQELGLSQFPVFTRKEHTDISYIACSRRLLQLSSRLYPQFATHNAHSAAAVIEMASGIDGADFEFQRLHGMGEALHNQLVKQGYRSRIYAPVGEHRDLLAYLVRRLLENGANGSFVHQLLDPAKPAREIARDPFEATEKDLDANKITLPANLYAPERAAAAGYDLTDHATLAAMDKGMAAFAAPYIWHFSGTGASQIINPARSGECVGQLGFIVKDDLDALVKKASASFLKWEVQPIHFRAQLLRRVADIYEENAYEIFALLAREAGKSRPDAIAELREAVDFLRYYASRAEEISENKKARGVILCISPWNFPLAIFTGQIAAALVAGNAVIAKPAEQTPLIAHRAISWMHEAGIPEDVLQGAYGAGEIGAGLVAHPGVKGVCFTGSTEVAKSIEIALAERAPEAMLIAETGGLNAMIADSTALPEQLTRDIIASAFQSAGQRCSALRILYIQEEAEDRLLRMLQGAIQCLRMGDPWHLSTDIGPVIEEEARAAIQGYIDRAKEEGRLIYQASAPGDGYFIGPALIRVSSIERMQHEVFGPVLHVASYKAEELDQVTAAINAKGYGLTLGIHSRIDQRIERIVSQAKIGNIYVNRNQIGAIVGSQPFGGEGLSGTGPKAGGLHYLKRFFQEHSEKDGVFEPIQQGRLSNDTSFAKIADTLAPSPGKALPEQIPELYSWFETSGGKASKLESEWRALERAQLLPGPTGEENELFLCPRGLIYVSEVRPLQLAEGVARALHSGNAVLLLTPEVSRYAVLEEVGLPLKAISSQDFCLPPEEIEIAATCAAPGMMWAEMRRALAKRHGAILPVLAPDDPFERYMLERCVCTDLTASGGNAELLRHNI